MPRMKDSQRKAMFAKFKKGDLVRIKSGIEPKFFVRNVVKDPISKKVFVVGEFSEKDIKGFDKVNKIFNK